MTVWKDIAFAERFNLIISWLTEVQRPRSDAILPTETQAANYRTCTSCLSPAFSSGFNSWMGFQSVLTWEGAPPLKARSEVRNKSCCARMIRGVIKSHSMSWGWRCRLNPSPETPGVLWPTLFFNPEARRMCYRMTAVQWSSYLAMGKTPHATFGGVLHPCSARIATTGLLSKSHHLHPKESSSVCYPTLGSYILVSFTILPVFNFGKVDTTLPYKNVYNLHQSNKAARHWKEQGMHFAKIWFFFRLFTFLFRTWEWALSRCSVFGEREGFMMVVGRRFLCQLCKRVEEIHVRVVCCFSCSVCEIGCLCCESACDSQKCSENLG